MTTQDKLTRLIDTKIAIRQAIMNLGVDVPYDTPFSGYPELISKIVGDFEETTTDQDLLQMVDAYNFLGIDGYEDHTYTDEELQKINELIDIIINGPEEVEPELEPTVLLITNIGETRYHEGETFSLDGYTITAVYGDGRRVDVTADCSFTPSVELVTEDEYVTISCEIDGTILTVKQAINVTVAPTFVDYIQSSGTQYINTEFIPNQNTKVELSVVLDAGLTQKWVYGSRTSSNDGDKYCFYIESADTGDVWYQYYAGETSDGTTIATTGTNIGGSDIIIETNKNVLSVNGSVIDTRDVKSFNGVYAMFLLALNNGGTVDTRMFSGKFYRCKIYDSDVLVRDFKPCRDGEGVYCLYDTVKKKYHYNQGTGVFIGDNFVEPTQLDYIESTGTQWIDTEILPILNTKLVVDCKFDNLSAGRFGTYGNQSTGRRFYFGVVSSQWVVGYGADDGYNHTLGAADTYRHTFEINDSSLLIDDTVVYSYIRAWTSTSGNIGLFGMTNAVTPPAEHYVTGKMFSAKIYQNDILIRDYVPYKDKFGVVCVKDLVEDKYYYNKGTGVFKSGTLLEPEQLEYIESTGTQYIDTGFIPTQNTRVKTQIAFPTIAQQQYAAIAGTQNNENGTNAFLMFCTNSLNARTGDSGNITTGLYAETDKSYDLELTFNDYTINGDSFSGELTWTKDITGTLYLFARNCAAINTVYPDSRAIVQLGYFQIYEGDTLVRNYVPYKDEFGVICLKDLVENKYYYNKGTGMFRSNLSSEPLVLYSVGDECLSVTGGWQARGWAETSSSTAYAPTLTLGDTQMTGKYTSSRTYRSGVIEPVNDVDLTNYNTIQIIYDATGGAEGQGTDYIKLMVNDRNDQYINDSIDAQATLLYIIWSGPQSATVSQTTVSLDISNITGYKDVFLMFRVYNTTISANIKDIRLL